MYITITANASQSNPFPILSIGGQDSVTRAPCKQVPRSLRQSVHEECGVGSKHRLTFSYGIRDFAHLLYQRIARNFRPRTEHESTSLSPHRSGLTRIDIQTVIRSRAWIAVLLHLFGRGVVHLHRLVSPRKVRGTSSFKLNVLSRNEVSISESFLDWYVFYPRSLVWPCD